jgi:hypothetical protein
MSPFAKTVGYRPDHGSDDTEQAWLRQCRESPKPYPFMVAPQSVVVTHDGRRLVAGDEVQLARDFAPIADRIDDSDGSRSIITGVSPQRQLDRLVEDGIVLARGARAADRRSP